MKKIIDELIKTCEHLITSHCPWDSDNYSDTMDSMIKYFDRGLTNQEITCLSLSRAYGLTPFIPDECVHTIFCKVWPQNNPMNIWLSWNELLITLKQINKN
jgi:hypothetical protein